MAVKNIRIGELLESMGYVNAAQVQQALDYQKEHAGTRMGDALITLGFVTERQMLEALAMKLGLRFVNMSDVSVQIAAVETIPRQLSLKYGVLAAGLEGDNLTVLTNDPLNYYGLEDIRQITGKALNILLVEKAPLSKAIAYYYAEVSAQSAAKNANQMVAGEVEADTVEMSDDDTGDAPVIRLLDSLIKRAVSTHASDIHIEPFETFTLVRMRIDGVIQEYTRLRRSLHQPLCARIKILSNLDIAERRLPQDGHFRAAVSETENINIRVSVLPTVFGEKVVIRLLDSRAVIEQAACFGMNEHCYQQFLPMLNCPNGIIYITGPTGSGKTTTLYMVLEYLARRKVNIATIEDPVEKNIMNINQTQVNTTAGLSFGIGLRALLRQDPDIIMVGETRDNETASIAVRAAITGHVVFSTLHTNDAVSSVVRLQDMGLERYLIGNSLVGVIAQRLMRKNCPHCTHPRPLTEPEKLRFGGRLSQVSQGVGCPECNFTGYSGRVAIHEIMVVDKTMRSMIADGATVEEMTKYAVSQGMTTLEQGAFDLLQQGLSTPEEMLRITYYNE